MKHYLGVLVLAGLMSIPAQAALNVGAMAPDFSARASLGGEQFDFSLAEALANGPVVLYFYPAAFTTNCTIEANAFAEATDDLAAMNATVIGVSGDDIETLDRFSVSECRGKFAVAADADLAIMKAYDTENTQRPGRATRTSYVVAPGGEVIFSHTGNDPIAHVAMVTAAVEQWHAEHGGQ